MAGPSYFWRINIGHVVSILILLGGLFTFFLVYHDKIQTTAAGLANHIEIHKTEATSRTTADLIIHDRLKALEETKAQIAPQLSRMDEKLNNINDWIKEQKQRVASP